MKIDERGLGELASTLRKYAEVSGKKLGDVVANEARQWGWELFTEFRKLSPKPGSILSAAISRGWKMGRRGDRLAPSSGGVSSASMRRARSMLAGQDSDYFRVNTAADGMIQIRRVRFSGRRSRKFLQGGRFGSRFAKGSLRASQLTQEQLQNSISGRSDVKRLNITALSAALELLNRQKAAKGGTLAVQWLPSVWKRRKSSMVKTGPLVVNSPTGYQLGRVDFESDSAGILNAVVISGNAPGTQRQLSKHGIVSRVATSRIADRRAYIRRKLAEAKAESF